MIKDFLIINCIGKDDKIGLKINSNFYIYDFDKKYHQFEILPHLSIPQSYNFFVIGDALRSIHPVAGQGWNLGIKDIQQLMTLLGTHDLNNQMRVRHLSGPFIQ